jgi:hypothetical protein
MFTRIEKIILIKLAIYKLLITTIVVVFSSNAYSLNSRVLSIKYDHEITAEVNFKGDLPELIFKLKNISSKNLKFYPDALSRHNMTIYIVKEGFSARPLEEIVAIDDAGVGVLSVPSGGSLIEHYVLSRLFPELLDALSESNIIIFWSIRVLPYYNSNTNPSRFGGAIHLGRELISAHPEK